MAAVKVGEIVVGMVTGVGGTIRVTVQGVRGVVVGPPGQVKVGDRLKLRVVEVKSDGGFVGARVQTA